MLLEDGILAWNLDVCPLSLVTKEESKDLTGTFVLRPLESLRRVCGPTQLPFAETESWASKCCSDIHQGNKLLGAILLQPENQDSSATILAS